MKKSVVKKTAIVRKLDNLGRMVIPVKMRSDLDIKEGDSLEILVDSNRIILRKYEPSIACVFCGNGGEVTEFKDKIVCKECLAIISQGVVHH